jgi:hypothetical protein
LQTPASLLPLLLPKPHWLVAVTQPTAAGRRLAARMAAGPTIQEIEEAPLATGFAVPAGAPELAPPSRRVDVSNVDPHMQGPAASGFEMVLPA